MSTRASKREDKHEVWKPPLWEKTDVRAIQALAIYAGLRKPLEDMQDDPQPPQPYEVRRALEWILFKACAVKEHAEFAGDYKDVVLGRQSVAKFILKMVELNPAAFEQDKGD